MKAKLLKFALVIVVAIVSVVNIFNAQKSVQLSDLAMANVEALAADKPEIWIGTPCMETPDNYCIYLSTTSNEAIVLPGVFAQ